MDEARIAVVTGGTGGLGRVVVEALLGDGWTVHVPWRTQAHADALAAKVGGRSSRLHLTEADVSRPEDVERLFAGVDLASGRLDGLCNLAGGFAAAKLADSTPAMWREMIDINATSAFLCARAAAPQLKESGRGAIVNVASAAALTPRPGIASYVAAKAAVIGLTRALAAELAPDRITVNAVAPATIADAEKRAAAPPGQRAGWVTPAELAGTILWLLGAEARQVTGTVIQFGG